MPDWRNWHQMAVDSQRAAEELETVRPRSCVSRIYYSAYQAVTAVLLYRGCLPPADREAWTHEETPRLITEQADYVSEEDVDGTSVNSAMRDGNFLLKVATDLLP